MRNGFNLRLLAILFARTGQMMSCRGLGGFFGQGGVVAFAVDGGDFAAHGAKIGRKLAAMMNGVEEAELEKEDGGLLEQAAEVNDFGELFAGKFGKGFEIFGVRLFVPCGDFAREVTFSGIFTALGLKTPLMTVSRKKFSAMAICRTSSLADLAQTSG